MELCLWPCWERLSHFEEMIMRRVALLTIAFGFLVPLLASAPAHAQATRTWVSGVGDDANPCSRTAPCKTFAGAISKTSTFGEINVLDPGGFGALTVTKSITVKSDHVEAGVLVAGTNGIIVNVPAATDRVQLEGLDFEGLGSGINGVQIVGSGTTTIIRCRINGFTSNGVSLVGTSGARAVVIGHRFGLPEGVDDGVLDAGIGQVVQRMVQQRLAAELQQRLGQCVGQRPHVGAEASGQHHRPMRVGCVGSDGHAARSGGLPRSAAGIHRSRARASGAVAGCARASPRRRHVRGP